jgi:hypothetical protein
MCVLSMVHDHYLPKFPEPVKTPSGDQFNLQGFNMALQIEELKKLIADFKEAIAAAKKVDELTNQPDCVDPAKAVLMTRVQELEKHLAKLKTPKAKKKSKSKAK